MRIIALEEHFVSQRFHEVAGTNMAGQRGVDMSGGAIEDLAGKRLRDMDDSGIDLQVLSHVIPSFDPIPPDADADIARAANDQAAAAVAAHPDRFAAFAALPMTDPDAAAGELHRAVMELGFRGALINGRADGRFLDHPSLFPVLEGAAQLGVPLYLHPGLPTAELRAEHYGGFGPSVSFALGTAAWGWHAESGLHALRLIAAGIFDRLPDLQIILGHMGEMLPFMIDRADEWLTPVARLENGLRRGVADTIRSNFWMTTSGMFSVPQFLLLHQVIGADRLMFSVDYPLSANSQGRAFLDQIPVNPADKEKLSHLNAERLLGLPAA